MNAYDIDGVLTKGLKPDIDDVIITGRSYMEASETYSMLFKKGIFNAVYFNPLSFDSKTIEESGKWKGNMAKKLNINIFYEDDKRQIKIIKEIYPEVIIKEIK
jgi:acid phosphatase class B